jgi:hypothetical protein
MSVVTLDSLDRFWHALSETNRASLCSALSLFQTDVKFSERYVNTYGTNAEPFYTAYTRLPISESSKHELRSLGCATTNSVYQWGICRHQDKISIQLLAKVPLIETELTALVQLLFDKPPLLPVTGRGAAFWRLWLIKEHKAYPDWLGYVLQRLNATNALEFLDRLYGNTIIPYIAQINVRSKSIPIPIPRPHSTDKIMLNIRHLGNLVTLLAPYVSKVTVLADKLGQSRLVLSAIQRQMGVNPEEAYKAALTALLENYLKTHDNHPATALQAILETCDIHIGDEQFAKFK